MNSTFQLSKSVVLQARLSGFNRLARAKLYLCHKLACSAAKMELAKAQRSFMAIPSRWPPILLGLMLGLFITAFCTSNFAMTWTRIAPLHIDLTSSKSSYHSITTTAAGASINQLFIQFLFKSSHTNAAHGLHRDNAGRPYTRPHIPHLKDSVALSQSANDYLNTGSGIGRRPTSKKQPASNADNSMEASSDGIGSSSSSQRKTHEQVHTDSQSSKAGSTIIGKSLHGTDAATAKRSQAHHKSSYSPLNPVNPECDISIGRWIQDDTYPLYNPGSCPFVDEGFNCQMNGRPDAGYTKWRWAPRDCTVPRFNGTDMLQRLRGKRMAFVGDSLNRNQWESLLCMLRESLTDKSRVVQVQGNHISKLPGAYGFKFLDYDLRIEFYASPYLVDKQDTSNQMTRYIIRLDKMDQMERSWRTADVLVFNTGHWWTPDKIGKGENCFQEGNQVHTKLDVMVAYRKALTTWANWVDRYINPQNTTVFFRGYSPIHYNGGHWNSGGQCQNETEPIYKESYLTAYPHKMQSLESIVQSMRVPVHVLNITRLSDFRKDGHPAVFGHPPHQVVSHQDCSHWCLPGLPDTWNELLSFALFKKAQSTYID